MIEETPALVEGPNPNGSKIAVYRGSGELIDGRPIVAELDMIVGDGRVELDEQGVDALIQRLTEISTVRHFWSPSLDYRLCDDELDFGLFSSIRGRPGDSPRQPICAKCRKILTETWLR